MEGRAFAVGIVRFDSYFVFAGKTADIHIKWGICVVMMLYVLAVNIYIGGVAHALEHQARVRCQVHTFGIYAHAFVVYKLRYCFPARGYRKFTLVASVFGFKFPKSVGFIGFAYVVGFKKSVHSIFAPSILAKCIR